MDKFITKFISYVVLNNDGFDERNWAGNNTNFEDYYDFAQSACCKMAVIGFTRGGEVQFLEPQSVLDRFSRQKKDAPKQIILNGIRKFPKLKSVISLQILRWQQTFLCVGQNGSVFSLRLGKPVDYQSDWSDDDFGLEQGQVPYKNFLSAKMLSKYSRVANIDMPNPQTSMAGSQVFLFSGMRPLAKIGFVDHDSADVDILRAPAAFQKIKPVSIFGTTWHRETAFFAIDDNCTLWQIASGKSDFEFFKHPRRVGECKRLLRPRLEEYRTSNKFLSVSFLLARMPNKIKIFFHIITNAEQLQKGNDKLNLRLVDTEQFPSIYDGNFKVWQLENRNPIRAIILKHISRFSSPTCASVVKWNVCKLGKTMRLSDIDCNPDSFYESTLKNPSKIKFSSSFHTVTMQDQSILGKLLKIEYFIAIF